MPIVSLKEVAKRYRKGRETIDVLTGIDLDIEDGDFLALMGPSGSGKTTLLNLIGGLDSPTSGAVVVGGESLGHLSARALAKWRSRNIGFVFQFYNLLPVLNARRNVELPLLLTNLSRAQRRKNAETALEIVGLGDRARHKPESCRAASNSAWRSRGRSSPTPRSSCATNPPAISIERRRRRSSTCSASLTANTGRPSSW